MDLLANPAKSPKRGLSNLNRDALTVVIVSARGLRNADWSPLGADKSDPYCICEVPGKRGVRIRTRTINNQLNPVWNHEAVLEGWQPGDPLKFTVFDKDFTSDDELGTVTLIPSQFEGKNGFSGDLRLLNAGKNRAFLTVKICRGKPSWDSDAVQNAAMAASNMGDETEVVSMKTRRRNARLGIKHISNRLTRRQFREFLIVEKARVEYCETMPFTLVLCLVFGLMAYGHGHVNSVYRLYAGVTRVVNEITVPQTLSDGTASSDLTLNSISSNDEMWAWLSNGLLPTFRGEDDRPGYVLNYNKVLGSLQLSQRRLVTDSCSNVNDKVANYVGLKCRTGDLTTASFGAALEEPLGNLSTDVAFVAGSGLDGGLLISKDQYYAFLDTNNPTAAASRIEELRSGGWCDEATDWVEARTAMFNGEVSAFIDVSIRFDFEDGGLVGKTLSVRPLHTPQWTTWNTAISIIFLVMMLLLLMLNLQEVLDRKAKRKAEEDELAEAGEEEEPDEGWLSYCNPCGRMARLWFGDFWLAVDWFGIFSGVGLVVLFITLSGVIAVVTSEVRNLESTTFDTETPHWNETADVHESYNTAARAYETSIATVFGQLNIVIEQKVFHRICTFGFTLYLLLRFLRGCLGQPYWATMIRTIEQALPDVVHLSLMLAICFENFALSGCLIFGSSLEAWSSVNNSHRAALAILSGIGDFGEMYEVYPVAAIVWLFLFAVVIVFIASNMIFAIMVDHYGQVRKDNSSASQTLLQQCRFLVEDVIWTGSFHIRRGIRTMQEKWPRVTQVTPYIDPEEPRVSSIPFDVLLEALEPVAENESADPGAVLRSLSEISKEDSVRSKAPAWTKGQPSWAPIELDVVVACGCDNATGLRLLDKAEAICMSRRPTDFPADMVYHEFTGQMRNIHELLAGTEEDMRLWMAERCVDCSNLEPRQRKFEALAVEKIVQRPREDEPMLMPTAYKDDRGLRLQALGDASMMEGTLGTINTNTAGSNMLTD
eukprot:CAMPEP_0206539970 /NCGR_PEP_ID=MMETSP0325_2-20121206/8721_1 /ASSEMBLY_ACC=CAM_ASM_000347 /TAXON_ID=2866 /ORGANISM="Crypthecodinium cohnii, Strain Seligo" /LENGTH=995 /DNA_ID=CAMNT_0054037593 /DNA_START=87 /DNA_END=3074 /DNA_ORIENTATION=+